MSRIDSHRLARIAAMEGHHFWSIGRDVLTGTLMERYELSDPMLDAGSGTSVYAQILRDHGRSITWFDIGLVQPPGLRASITAIPIADGSVATVLARDVLEHVDDAAAMAEITRVLRPGGHALITVPGWPVLWGPRDEAAGHLRRYRRRDLLKLAAEHGLEVVDLRGYQFLLLPVIIVSRLLQRDARSRVQRREEGPTEWINKLLTRVNVFEARLARGRLRPPTGSSLVMVARRP